MNSGAFAIIIHDARVLMVRSKTTPEWADHWSMPGGVVDNGETPSQAAKREVFEEVGLTCEIGELLTTIDNHAANIRIYLYFASYVSGDIRLDHHEIAEAAWLSYEEAIAKPLAFNYEAVLKGIKAHF